MGHRNIDDVALELTLELSMMAAMQGLAEHFKALATAQCEHFLKVHAAGM